MRRDARVEALSAVTVEGATAAEGSWTLDEGDTVSPGTLALSTLSGPVFDGTGNSDSSAPWKAENQVNKLTSRTHAH
jgi:hypothetical protein